MELYRIEVGRDDGVEVRHIVGAIANEGDISSRYIGNIKLFGSLHHRTAERHAGRSAAALYSYPHPEQADEHAAAGRCSAASTVAANVVAAVSVVKAVVASAANVVKAAVASVVSVVKAAVVMVVVSAANVVKARAPRRDDAAPRRDDSAGRRRFGGDA
jgi:ATP-dependent RNA helicase DeaD